jgi:biopolymer transport protein ExbB/TolQ
MASTPTHRPTREVPLLVLALALVCAICIPLWQMSAASSGSEDWSKWTAMRVGKLLLGPEQIICYCCFVWACFILLGRYREVRRQQRAFGLQLLPTEAGVCILPEDARKLKREVESRTAAGGPYLLANMIRMALGKYAVSRSARDVNETVRTQADVDLGRMISSMSTVHYLAWAIPAVGFLGTVRGLAAAFTLSNKTDQGVVDFVGAATDHLAFAFDCTLVALALSLVLMFLLLSVQRDEEALVLDCQQYCLEHLISRLYEVEPDHHAVGHDAAGAVLGGPLPLDASPPRR